MDTKYIVFDLPLQGYVAIIFPPCISHRDMAMKMGIDYVDNAGFVKLDDKRNATLYGRSSSLNVDSNPAFNDMVTRMFKSEWE